MKFLETMLPYFQAEKIEALVFILPIGLLCLVFGGWLLSEGQPGFSRGVAIPFVVMGLVLSIVGGTVGFRTPMQTAQIQQAYEADPTTALKSESARMEKVNAELVAITYGALVSQLFKAKSDPKTIESDLKKIGHNMGVRLIDEFLAKSNQVPCQTFRDVMETLSKIGVKMFLGIDTELTELGPKSYVVSFPENPLNDFVELQYGQAH